MATRQLAGRRALVTGGSRGIGAAIVRRLVAEGADAAFTFSSSADVADRLRCDIGTQGAPRSRFRPTTPTPHRSVGQLMRPPRSWVVSTSW